MSAVISEHTVPPNSLHNLQNEATGFEVSHDNLGMALPPTLSLASQLKPFTSSVLSGLLFTLSYTVRVGGGPLLSEMGNQGLRLVRLVYCLS